MAARPLAPRIKYCEARGPAPQRTKRFTRSDVPSLSGRVAPTKATRKPDHFVGDGHGTHELLHSE